LSVAVSGLTGQIVGVFSYDAPAVTFAGRFNGATFGGTSITLSGINFGASNRSPTIRVGFTECTTTSWRSNTAVLCQLADGYAASQSIALSVHGLIGTSFQQFSYDSPSITALGIPNAAGSGDVHVTLVGFNFASVDPSLTVRVGMTQCGTSGWTSSTAARCRLPNSGSGLGLNVAAEVFSKISTGVALFSYDAPVITLVTPIANAATTAGITISLIGANFGQINFSESAQIGSTACTRTSYLSDTMLLCSVPPGSGGALKATFSRQGAVGTMCNAFTYDSPVITEVVTLNGPAKSGAVVTIRGTNFGPSGSSPTGFVGNSVCANTAWITPTTIECLTAMGTRQNHMLGVVLTGRVGTSSSTFTFDAPLITLISSQNGPMAGRRVSLLGLNFGQVDVSPTVKLGQTSAAAPSWVADSLVTFQTPSAAASGLVASLQIGITIANSSLTFTYDAPVLSAIASGNGPTAGGSTLTIFGANLGGDVFSPVVQIGGVACAVLSSSLNRITCTVPAGAGTGRAIAVSVNGLVSTRASAFSYDSPVVRGIVPANGPLIGLATITISGINFGAANNLPTVFIGGTACITSIWLSAVFVICLAPVVN